MNLQSFFTGTLLLRWYTDWLWLDGALSQSNRGLIVSKLPISKTYFRYFANTKNSFADEFVRLVRNRLCPDSSQLTQNFKNMSLDQSLVGECCFIAIRDSKKDKKQILSKIRSGVSKYFRKEVHRAKPNVLKWNCDEQNQVKTRSQLYWWVLNGNFLHKQIG